MELAYVEIGPPPDMCQHKIGDCFTVNDYLMLQENVNTRAND